MLTQLACMELVLGFSYSLIGGGGGGGYIPIVGRQTMEGPLTAEREQNLSVSLSLICGVVNLLHSSQLLHKQEWAICYAAVSMIPNLALHWVMCINRFNNGQL